MLRRSDYMYTSNVVSGSNVFLCRTEHPLYDPEFVKQIVDAQKLNELIKRKKFDSKVSNLNKKQLAIADRGTRCMYAESDPCIGFVEGKGIVIKCINTNCPGIKNLKSFHGRSPWKGCNPDVSKDYISMWAMNPNDELVYGNPKSLSRYYLVDLISDEEMDLYISNPGNAGVDHPTPPAPILEDKEEVIKGQYEYINPKTGKKMIIVGYKKLQYPDEDGIREPIWQDVEEPEIPIWGVVDRNEQEKNEITIRRTKKIEKLSASKSIKKNLQKNNSLDDDEYYKKKEEYEEKVSKSIVDDIHLTDIDADFYGLTNVVILLENPAEAAYVSQTLLVSNVEHGFSNNENVVVTTIDDYLNYLDRTTIVLSDTVITKGCSRKNTQSWSELANQSNLIKLRLSRRDYVEYSCDFGIRWACRSMYGVTHVCINKNDFEFNDQLTEGLTRITLIHDGSDFLITDRKGNELGYTNAVFDQFMNYLVEKDDIVSYPEKIKGLALSVYKDEINVLGMGHLKFSEY